MICEICKNELEPGMCGAAIHLGKMDGFGLQVTPYPRIIICITCLTFNKISVEHTTPNRTHFTIR